MDLHDLLSLCLPIGSQSILLDLHGFALSFKLALSLSYLRLFYLAADVYSSEQLSLHDLGHSLILAAI